MAAHLRSIEHKCEHYGCTSIAKVQLYNTWNAPMGRYCKKHGEKALKEHKRNHE